MVCERGIVTTLGNDHEWQVREEGGVNQRGRAVLRPGRYPAFEHSSPGVHLIMDLVHSLDTGAPTRGGVRIARTNTELIFACLESHRNGGITHRAAAGGQRTESGARGDAPPTEIRTRAIAPHRARFAVP